MISPIDPSPFACPRCDRAPLTAAADLLRCDGCKVDFPVVGGLPWLFAEPAAALGEWRGRMHFLEQTLAHRHAELGAALARKGLRATTRRRIEKLAQAIAAHRTDLTDLLAPLATTSLAVERATHLALRTKLPSDQGLTTYYGNVHRDWSWGEAENRASFEIVDARLGGRDAGRTLVLGCGAGRLAHDIQNGAKSAHTIGLDFNPLLLFVAARMAGGETLGLWEFPVAPIDLEHVCVRRELRAPEPAEIVYCIADVHRPPFPPRSFDTIVTPWLVDIVPEPFDGLARRINRLLDDGGTWINFGSLSFHSADPAMQHSPEECREIVEESGFEPPSMHDDRIPYLSSPASRHARTERVVSWSASKRKHIGKTDRHEALPDWIVRGKDPVPAHEFFRTQAMSTRIHAYILSLIDGKRSIADMAVMLEQQRLMPRAEAEPAIRQFMIRLYEDSQRGSRY